MKISKIKIIKFSIIILTLLVFSIFYLFKFESIKSPPNNIKIDQNLNKNNTPFIFTVENKSYKISVKENTSLYDAMKILEKEQGLTFTSKIYPYLGIFIESINDIPQDGKYWIYYVNGVEGSVGVSNYIIKPNDVIDWKLKKAL